MTHKSTIEFQETSGSAADFLHELNDPDILRNRQIPPQASLVIRRQQVARLKENIRVLVTKREEFNKKMEDYIRNLTVLVEGIEQRIARDGDQLHGDVDTVLPPGSTTRVRCMACENETIFQGLQVLFAKESQDSFTRPTAVYVLDGSRLRKGHFCCGSCGTDNLVIRSGS